MSVEICRLCLSEDNLLPIFMKPEQSARCSADLSLTTGLKVEVNDGLPQNICRKCTDAVNSALHLRNTSQCSERELINRGYIRKTENIIKEESDSDSKDLNITYNENIFDNIETNDGPKENNDSNNETHDSRSDDHRLPKLIEVEIEFDRLSQDGSQTKGAWNTKKMSRKEKRKMSRKEKRQMYLDLVEGTLDPKGPVTCKVCKKTVSRWQCFLSHAKLHLGFDFVCEYCGKSFITTTRLKRHCRSYHGMQRELACKLCGYLALDNAQLKLHERRIHTGERPYVCDTCSAAYHSRKCLLQHLESHREDASVQCEQCPRLFKSQRQLSRHRYRAHSRHCRTHSHELPSDCNTRIHPTDDNRRNLAGEVVQTKLPDLPST